jgi:hypothetical protein
MWQVWLEHSSGALEQVSPCHALLHGSCSKAPLASLLKSHLGPLSASLLQRQNSPLVLLCSRCSASTSRLGVPTAPTKEEGDEEEITSSKVSTQHTHDGIELIVITVQY